MCAVSIDTNIFHAQLMCKLIDYIDYRNSTGQSIFDHFNQGQFFNYYADAKETFSVQQDEN